MTEENGTNGNKKKDNLQHLIYKSAKDNDGKPSLQVLDQLLIPDKKEYVDVTDVDSTWSVIRKMQIRGAPLIAVVAMLGLAVHVAHNPPKDDASAHDEIVKHLDHLATSRPTAVNLFNAIAELKEKLTALETKTVKSVVDTVIEFGEFCLARDLEDNRNIGKHGADELLKGDDNEKAKLTIMTICNTGSLATAGFGTALGVVRALIERDALEKIVALETRPYNQGSRLTAFEMVCDDMPNPTLICDSMAASFMSSSTVHAAVVGADRVCANGDTANKIGTYNLSLVAQAHKVPVYVAAPLTTLDVNTATGSDITIEQRPASELLSTSRAPNAKDYPNLQVWNPAFDVTPAKLIAGIITEKGVIVPDLDGKLDVAGFVAKHTSGEPPSKKQKS